MSFNWFARKVRNRHKPQAQRFGALRSCLIRLNSLTQEGYHAIMQRYDAQFNFCYPQLPSNEQLAAALAQAERERNMILEHLRRFERRRIRQKMKGKRQLSRHERDCLGAVIQEVWQTRP
jgi:hypothetical protein